MDAEKHGYLKKLQILRNYSMWRESRVNPVI